MSFGGGSCFESQCHYNLGVEAPGTLVLQDAEGEVRIEVDDAAVLRVLQLAEAATFTSNHAEALCGWVDAERVFSAQRNGEPGDLACESLSEDQREEIGRSLRALWTENLGCPAWEEPADFSLDSDPFPVRALCFFCKDSCIANGL